MLELFVCISTGLSSPLAGFPLCFSNENVQQSQLRTWKAIWKCSLISELIVLPMTPAVLLVQMAKGWLLSVSS